MAHVAEARQAAMSRGDAPADVQWARALTAVAIAFVLASCHLCRLNVYFGVN